MMHRKLFCSASAFVLAALSAPAFADAPAPQNSSPQAEAAAPGEIVVTAQKREQNVQKVGIAITALGKDALKSIGRQDVTALEGQVPSLAVNQYSPTITVFNIRGVSQNDFTDAQEAPIAFYDDEIYIASLGAITGMNFDLDRVEVLRGPQGTLFGRNATGGLVQFVSAKPTDKTEGYLTLTGGSYGQFATEGALGGKIIDGLNGRFSFTTNNSGGYITDTNGPSLGNAKFYGLRGQLAATLGPRDKLSLKVQTLRNDHERSGGLYSWAATYPDPANHDLGNYAQNVPGGMLFGQAQGADAGGYINPSSNPFVQSENGTSYFNRTYWDASLRWEHDFGWSQLTSITDYQHLSKQYAEDSSVSPSPLFNYSTAQKMHQLSEELRLSGSASALHWVAGVYALKIHTDNHYQIQSENGIFGLPGDPTDLMYIDYGGTLDTDTIATFGQLEYAVTDHLSLIGGLRYNHDDKHEEFSDYLNGTMLFDWATTYPSAAPLRYEHFDNWSGKAEIDYKPNRDTLIYASVNRGTKSGGFSVISSTQPYTLNPANASSPGNPYGQPYVPAIPFGQEVLTNWEGGFKLTLLNRTTHFNGSFFYYNYQGYQAFQNVGTNQYITNHQAYEHGAEFEINTRPVAGLYLQAFLTLISNKVKNVELPDGTFADRVLPQAPKTTLGWLARYEFPVGPGKLSVETDWKYESGEYFETNNAPDDFQPAHTVGNARIAYNFGNGKYELAVFSNNITNKYYRVYNLDLSGLINSSDQTFARPRTWGGSLTVKY